MTPHTFSTSSRQRVVAALLHISSQSHKKNAHKTLDFTLVPAGLWLLLSSSFEWNLVRKMSWHAPCTDVNGSRTCEWPCHKAQSWSIACARFKPK